MWSPAAELPKWLYPGEGRTERKGGGPPSRPPPGAAGGGVGLSGRGTRRFHPTEQARRGPRPSGARATPMVIGPWAPEGGCTG